MITDALLAFVPPNVPLSLVAGAGINVPSTNVIDLLGLGVGVAPNSIIGNATVFGSPDAMGVGGLRPELYVSIGTQPVTANAATLNVALQAAVDQGVGGNYQPGTWRTIEETGPLAVGDLLPGTTIMRLPWVPPFPQGLRPRFLRLLFQVPAATNFSAGSIGSALVTTGRDDPFQKYAPNNFTVQ